jgi:FtsX-like permease family
MLSLFAVLYVTNRPDAAWFGNGYDVRVRSAGSATVQLPAAIRADLTRSLTLPTRGYLGPVIGADASSSTERTFLPLFQVPPNVADDPPVRLAQRDHRFASDQAVWQALAADPVQALLDQAYRGSRALLQVIDALMRMGLVVGILGLGIVALRVVTEHHQVIGILRAIGYQRRSVILAMLTESATTATIGSAVGIAAGVAMGYLFYRQSDARSAFGIDLASLGGVLGLIYLAVLLVTLGPAWKASRLPPAQAVQHTE